MESIEEEVVKMRIERDRLANILDRIEDDIQLAKEELDNIREKTITAYRELFNVINLKGEYGLPLEGGAE